MSTWAPEIGDVVWLNWPDANEPLGKVVGYVPEGHPRAGQPVIEATEDREPRGLFDRGQKKGDQFVTHPMFLLPFKCHGDEWQKAAAEGRIVGSASRVRY